MEFRGFQGSQLVFLTTSPTSSLSSLGSSGSSSFEVRTIHFQEQLRADLSVLLSVVHFVARAKGSYILKYHLVWQRDRAKASGESSHAETIIYRSRWMRLKWRYDVYGSV